jgi:MFS family permease
MALGFFHSFFGPSSYSLVADLFPVSRRTQALSVYSILIMLGETISALTIVIIGAVGWNMTFRICGGFGLVTAIIGMLVMSEPKRDIDIDPDSSFEQSQNEEQEQDEPSKIRPISLNEKDESDGMLQGALLNKSDSINSYESRNLSKTKNNKSK